MSRYSVRKYFEPNPRWYVCKHKMTLDGAAHKIIGEFDNKEEADNLKLQLEALDEHDRKMLKIAFAVGLVLALVGTGLVVGSWLHDHCAVNVCEEDVGG
jgi:hypothetical protein